jgi:hypothetical protein
MSSVVGLVDYCRALEGVGPLELPSNYDALTIAEQMLVVFDLERVNRGETPIVGLSASLDGYAQRGARNDTDPAFPPGSFGNGIWAGGEASTVGADSMWMYDDGYRSANVDCTKPGGFGCWGHRGAILLNILDATETLVGGGGYASTGEGPSYAFLMLYGYKTSDLVFTWASELRYFSTPPAVEPLPPPTVTGISPTWGSAVGGTTVTISGTYVAGTIKFGTVLATDVTCTSDSSCTAESPPGSPGTVAVTLTTTAGTIRAGTFTYVAPIARATRGNGQSAVSGDPFNTPLSAAVDVSGNPVPEDPVTFTVIRGSASFGSRVSVESNTGSRGVATAPRLLTAGSTPGLVIVTATAAGVSLPATYRLTVLPAGANLDVKLSGPRKVPDGLTFQVVTRVTNHGPSTATRVVTKVVLPTSSLAITEQDGATRSGSVLTWTTSILARGRSTSYVIVLKVLPRSNSSVAISATTYSQDHDPDTANNTARMALRLG